MKPLFIPSIIILLGAGLCLAATPQQPDLSTQPLESLPEGAVDVSARLGGPAATTNLPTLPEDGYWIDNAPINEVFQYLARSAGLQFFFNNELVGPEYTVTGHLKLDNPRQQMDDLAMAYGLTVYQQQSTVALMTELQQARLPVEVMSYQLKYLRGAALNRSSSGGGSSANGGGAPGRTDLPDFEKLKSIIRPMLTREVGQIEFEEKTNTLLVTDNTVRLERVRKLLEEIDRAKQQIMVNVRVLRIKRNQGRHVGIDWRKALGEAGTTITATQNLNALFNLPNTNTVTLSGPVANPGATLSQTYTPGAGLVFASTQVSAILRALEEADIVTQEACPTVITEDNEQGVISIVDRFPVITSDVSITNGIRNVTDKVRYLIDESDPNATDEPEKSREIGVTLSVTPTLLPDGTVRMKLRPRVAKIVELIPGESGNVFPRVSESTVEAISRIPKGQSLFLGGFYDYSNADAKNKVPVLGSLPLINRLFSSDAKKLEQVSLVFVITPRVYDASSPEELAPINWDVKEYSGMQPDDIADSTLLLPEAGWQDGKAVEVPAMPPPAPRESWMKRMFTRSPSPADAAAPEYPRTGRSIFSRR